VSALQKRRAPLYRLGSLFLGEGADGRRRWPGVGYFGRGARAEQEEHDN
jgi:hypothetical protein